jgi:hypothetical protein
LIDRSAVDTATKLDGVASPYNVWLPSVNITMRTRRQYSNDDLAIKAKVMHSPRNQVTSLVGKSANPPDQVRQVCLTFEWLNESILAGFKRSSTDKT